MHLCLRSAIPVSGAAHDLLRIIHIPVRRYDSERLIRRDRRALRHVIKREHLRACAHVRHQRDGHRRTARPHVDAVDDADAQRTPSRPLSRLAKLWLTQLQNCGLQSSRRPKHRFLRAGEQRSGARELQLEHNAQRRGHPVLLDAVHVRIHKCGGSAAAAGAGHRLRGRAEVHR